MDSTQHDGRDNLKRFRRFTAFLAIFLILLGQYLIFSSPVSEEGTVIPPNLWLGILGVMIFVAGQAVRPPAFLLKFFGRFSNAGTPGWIGASVIFSLLAAFASAAFEKFTRVNYIPVLTLWFISIACYVAAFTHGAVSKGSWKDWFRQYRWEVLAVVVIMALAAAVRFYKLGVIPRVMDGDEGRLGLIAQSTLTGLLANPFALWENFGAIYLQGMNFFIRLYGPTMFALRFLPAVGGVLAIPATYLLARQMVGQRVALISAVLMAISHTHIHFSRIASVAYIQDTWLVPLELYFLLSGLEKRSAWRAAVGGAILAIHFGIYLSAQIVIAMLLVYMLVAFVFLRSWFRPLLRVGLAFWGSFLIVALPEAVYIWNHPNDFLNRLGADGTFQSGWLTQTMAVTGQSALEIFFGRAVHVFLSLIYYPALDFYGSPVPPLSLITAALFLLGVGIALYRTRSPGFLLLNGYFWAGVLAIGIFATPPSADSYRILFIFPASLIMVAFGLDQTLELFGLGWESARRAYVLSVIGILFSLFLFNMGTYYGDFGGKCRYGENLVGRFASYLGNFVRTVESESPIYLLSNNSYFYGSHASVDFLSQKRPIVNFPGSLDTLNPVSGETIIASPDRIAELEAWVRIHPGGKIHYEYDCTTTIMMVYSLP